MTRPRKKGLENFTLDVTFYNDAKIRKIIRCKGGDALSIYTSLLIKEAHFVRFAPYIITENGYYYCFRNGKPCFRCENPYYRCENKNLMLLSQIKGKE